jgi:hypothetical protein
MLRLSQSAVAHPWRWLAGLGALTLLFAAALGRLEVRTDGGALYPRHSPVVERSRADGARFHDADEVLVLAGARAGGPRLDTAAGLAFVAALHESLAARPGISGAGVTSLATWRGLDAQTGTASADDSTWAQAALRREPLVAGFYLAED